jgi:NADH dehydrogenase [ubiquinone] 1 alpha subcomplex assembly factor 7
MNALEREIRTLIASEGPIPVSRYMAFALGHPKHGYYMTRDPLGPDGDFITAPEVSQMFGELIGIWSAEVWRMMDAPGAVHLVELGPGRGTLMTDLVRAMKIVPEFAAAIDLHLVETSPPLAELQRASLASIGAGAQWHCGVELLPDGPLIVIANEFVDALPIDQLIRADDGWHERKVGVQGDRLTFALDPMPLPDIRGSLAKPGAVLERRHLAPVLEIARRIATFGGAALMIDYGHAQSNFGDTLQAVRAHRIADPLENPGEADLTSHVDFQQLATASIRAGVHAFGPVTQGDLLRRLGIELRAESLKRGKDGRTAALVNEAVKRLAGPSPGMGELFKALALVHPALPAPPGFDT